MHALHTVLLSHRHSNGTVLFVTEAQSFQFYSEHYSVLQMEQSLITLEKCFSFLLDESRCAGACLLISSAALRVLMAKQAAQCIRGKHQNKSDTSAQKCNFNLKNDICD